MEPILITFFDVRSNSTLPRRYEPDGGTTLKPLIYVDEGES